MNGNMKQINRNETVQHVNDSLIGPREALHGGRAEVLKTFYETKAPCEIIVGFDISSQYPAVMALDSYAVGARKRKEHCKTIEMMILNWR